MITITKQTNGVLFTFEDSNKYLYGSGTIEVPFNSLSVIQDESDMITLKKSASNDVFISARYDTDFGYESKDAAIADLKDKLFAANSGGGSGMTSGEVQTMIDESISGKADTSAVTAVANDVETLSGDVEMKQDALEFYSEETLEDDETGEYEKTGKIEAGNEDSTNFADVFVDFQHTSEGENYPFASIDANTNDGEGNVTLTNVSVDGATAMMFAQEDTDDGEGNVTTTDANVTVSPSGVNIYVNNPDGTTELSVDGNGAAINGNPIATEGYVDAAVSGKVSTSAITSSVTIDDNTHIPTAGAVYDSIIHSISGKVDTSAITTSVTSGSTDSEIPTAKAVFDAIPTGGTGGGSNIVEVTQAQYDALVSGGTVDPDALYIISDAPEINVSGYAQSSAVTAEIAAAVSGKADTSAVTAEITAAVSGKVDTTAITTSVTSGSTDAEIPTAKAVYDAIPTGGTGASYSAGTNISIDTGNTISCTLPITAYTNNGLGVSKSNNSAGTRAFAGGEGCGASGLDSFAYGLSNTASSTGSTAFGFKTQASVYSSFVCGKWNDIANANTGENFGSSGNTVFAVGNGWKQSDWTAGTANTHNALDIRQNGDIYFPDTDNTTYANYYEKPMLRLQDIYAALGGLKFVQCTQAEYDLLVQGGTVDSATIYFITNVVS